MNWITRIIPKVGVFSHGARTLQTLSVQRNSGGICSALQRQPDRVEINGFLPSLTIQTLRHVQRGKDYVANNLKRMRKHGKQKYLKTRNGKVILIKRMMKGVNPRVLTH